VIAATSGLRLIIPEWDAPPGVRALMTTREGGVSSMPFASLNLGTRVGDSPEAVTENRRRVEQALGVPIVVPNLVHGVDVVEVDRGSLHQTAPRADACWSRDPRVACGVTAADCLPVLLAADDGRAVAAAHAGWRGLAAGVLEQTVRVLVEQAGCAAAGLQAWLGPCIGPEHFEVGEDVLRAFGVDGVHPAPHFTPRRRSDGSAAWLADLPALARARLREAGVQRVQGGHWCTVADASRFFSHRRDRSTGRMLAAIACRS
jgi:polyphenol oxidase